MAKLSNINGRFAVEDDGAIQFNGSAGTSGYVLESRGASSPPVWTDRDTGNVTGSGTLNKVVRWTATGSTVGDGPITFATNDSTFAGNVGIGITPNTSSTVVDVLQLGKGMTIMGNVNDDRATMGANLYLDAATAFRYVMDGYAGRFSIEDGQMIWGVSAIGNEGDVATVNTKMTLLNSGNLGIGAASPSRKLVVAQSDVTEPSGIDANTGILIKNNTWSGIQMISTEATGNFITFGDNVAGFAGRIQYSHATNAMQFETAASEKMRITSAGEVGIGTTSPQSYDNESDNLVVAEGVNGTNPTPGITIACLADQATTGRGALRFADGAVGNAAYRGALEYNHNGDDMFFRTSSTVKMTLDTDGNLGIGTTSPQAILSLSKTDESSYTPTTAIDYSFMLGTRNGNATGTSNDLGPGIVWKYDDSTGTYTKKSAGIMQVGEGNYLRSGLAFYTNNNADKTTAWSEKMRLSMDGNLGIGTDSPDSLLVVQADAHNEAFAGKRSATDYLWFLRNENNSGRFQLYNSSSSQTIEMTGANGRITLAQMIAGTAFAQSNGGYATLGSTSGSVPIAIAIDGDASTASIVIPTNKNVGIGDTTAPNKLSVKETGNLVCRFTGGSTFSLIQNNTDGTVIFSANHGGTGSENRFIWQTDAGTAKMKLDSGTLTVSADLVAYGSPSDKRLKENIKPIKSALDKVEKLQGVTFDWKDKKQDKAYDPDQNWKHDIGFIAQDVQKVIPELVRENDNGMLSMRHQGIAPILLEAIKELKAEIEELKYNKCNCNK